MISLKKISCVLLSLIVVLMTSCKSSSMSYKSNNLMDNLYLANTDTYATGTAKNIVIPDITTNEGLESIGAESYFIASTNRFDSDYTKYMLPYKRVAIASLTKLMTALVVLKNCKNLDEKYYVTTETVDLDKDVSKANLKVGDEISVRDLLYGLLVPSGNDAAMCLAENLVGSYDNFIIMMNNEAEMLGATNTHFANPHGLDSDYHFSTAYDLFLIMRELIKYPEFLEISTTREFKANIKGSDDVVRTETWQNTNFFVTGELLINDNVKLLAGKTGSTENAGYCLALYTQNKNSGDEYISIVLNAKSKRNVYYNSNSLFGSMPD